MRNLSLEGEIPQALQDTEHLEMKYKKEQQKLYQMVMYTKEEQCRKRFIHHYFGLQSSDLCSACDLEQ
jgi:superfamily II DNA helicase RecQ